MRKEYRFIMRKNIKVIITALMLVAIIFYMVFSALAAESYEFYVADEAMQKELLG